MTTFSRRLAEGKLARDENPLSHFCIYFAAFDPIAREVFIGNHIKSGLWLFNGGHIDKNEKPEECVRRESVEEWGEGTLNGVLRPPTLFTIVDINNPSITCKTHFDVWYFIPTSKNQFHPDPNLLAKEFYETRWVNFNEAKKLVTDYANLKAISKIEAGD